MVTAIRRKNYTVEVCGAGRRSGMRNKSEAKVREMEPARVAAAKRVTDAERAIAGAAAPRQAYAG